MKKKTILAGILSACVVGSASVLSLTGSAADKVYGDANLDGSVDMSDCVLVMQSLANPDKYKLSAIGRFNADINNTGDGITLMDAQAMQERLLGLA